MPPPSFPFRDKKVYSRKKKFKKALDKQKPEDDEEELETLYATLLNTLADVPRKKDFQQASS